VDEQGELFGTHNIFKFDPNGFVPGNVRASSGTHADSQLEKVRVAEDRFVQDLIDAEYDSEEEDEEDSDVRDPTMTFC